MTTRFSTRRFVWLCSLAAEIAIGISFVLLLAQPGHLSGDSLLNHRLHDALHAGNLAFFLVSAVLFFLTALCTLFFNKSLGYLYIARFVLYFTAFLLIFPGFTWV